MTCCSNAISASLGPPHLSDRAAACGANPACLRAVPFTPSQGIATPSPTNVAAGIWYSQYSPHLFSQPGTPGHPYAVVWGPVQLSSAQLTNELFWAMLHLQCCTMLTDDLFSEGCMRQPAPSTCAGLTSWPLALCRSMAWPCCANRAAWGHSRQKADATRSAQATLEGLKQLPCLLVFDVLPPLPMTPMYCQSCAACGLYHAQPATALHSLIFTEHHQPAAGEEGCTELRRARLLGF